MTVRAVLLVNAVVLGLGVAAAGGVHAQDARDPTQPPRIGPAALPGGTTPSEGLTVMVRDGKPHLVVGTRWYAVGESVGHLRIDRITETEVWMHDGSSLIKTPRFAGISRATADCDRSSTPFTTAATVGSPVTDGTIQIQTHSPAPAPQPGHPADAGRVSNTVKCTP